jgi:DNA primase
MKKIVENEPYTFNCSGEDLAKVLTYYGYIPDISSNFYKIVCPFHQDVNPSMIVDLTEGNWYCFGCGLSGDALKFVSLINNDKSDLKALQQYLKILKSDKINKLDFSHRRIKPKKQSGELYNIAYDYYYGLSKINWKQINDEEIISAKNYMIQRGFTETILNECGAKYTYNKSYPIIFPMLDNGKFKGWVCRTTDKVIEQKRKYLYNEGFSRATTLVGDYENYDYVFVVEGYMDRLKFIQYGVKNVVAILGWKMSKEQEEKLRKSNIKYLISALDNDDCGRKGTEYLRSIFKTVYRFKYLKGIKDVGESNNTQFAKMLKKTLDQIQK